MTTGVDGALWTRDAVSLAAMIAAGEVSATQVVEAHLERIEQVDSGIGALTTVFTETARAEAASADRRTPTGPLHGVPVTVKNNLDVAGSPTTWGVAAFGQAVATADAPAVAALRRAGAIVIGRTNMPDFATRWHTDNDAAGPTVNPWYPTRSPGGSSGGDAAAVAAGMTPLGLGTDFGGSLRVPAAFCGIASLRTTPGRVAVASSLPGAAPGPTNQLFAAPGPLARTVRDLTTAFEVLSDSADPRDPGWIPVRDTSDTDLPAVAVMLGDEIDPQVRAALVGCADALAHAGHPVAELDPPQVGEVAADYGRLVSTEVVVHRREAMRRFGSTGLNVFVDAVIDLFPPLDLAGYLTALGERLTRRTAWSRFLAEHPIVLGPVSTELPWPVGYDLGGTAQVATMYAAHRLTIAANYLALPAVTVPAGLSAEGLPIGVQLITAPFAELRALRAAAHLEAAFPMPTPISPATCPTTL
ncbi:indole acetimide hydrolase [Nocardia sp. ET3-3]|uniref:Indole acetimide hydrolase n=1 Tax=Nocardia terrae TaxID=2675851 RepID=A0A7K1V0A0_9NOCA|nr:amidase family protein [Nocardia terrae]MVU80070.1 indole acetimide hydrolase [Nocardia terrae]